MFGRKFVVAGARPDSRGSWELNRRPGRPGEGQGGPNKCHLDQTISQKVEKNPFQGGMVISYSLVFVDGTFAPHSS